MKIVKHITFFYLENRIICINNIIDATNQYEFITDIYIHTNNKDLKKDIFNKYTNGNITILYHDLTNIDPCYLSWKCRDLLKKQKDDYDIFIYIEDDILVPYKAIKYWLKYSPELISLNYNLGFLRIEFDQNNTEFITDLHGEQFDTIVNLNNSNYCVNNKNPYCAFWIYTKEEFNKFVNSKYYDCVNIEGYGNDYRVQSAIGLHGKKVDWYKSTLIPVINNKLLEDCKIYHMPNNYVYNNYTLFATIKFDDCIKKDLNNLYIPN